MDLIHSSSNYYEKHKQIFSLKTCGQLSTGKKYILFGFRMKNETICIQPSRIFVQRREEINVYQCQLMNKKEEEKIGKTNQ